MFFFTVFWCFLFVFLHLWECSIWEQKSSLVAWCCFRLTSCLEDEDEDDERHQCSLSELWSKTQRKRELGSFHTWHNHIIPDLAGCQPITSISWLVTDYSPLLASPILMNHFDHHPSFTIQNYSAPFSTIQNHSGPLTIIQISMLLACSRINSFRFSTQIGSFDAFSALGPPFRSPWGAPMPPGLWPVTQAMGVRQTGHWGPSFFWENHPKEI